MFRKFCLVLSIVDYTAIVVQGGNVTEEQFDPIKRCPLPGDTRLNYTPIDGVEVDGNFAALRLQRVR